MGRWTIRTKIGNAIKQGASTVVLYFPLADIFSQQQVQNGWKDYIDYTNTSWQEVSFGCSFGCGIITLKSLFATN